MEEELHRMLWEALGEEKARPIWALILEEREEARKRIDSVAEGWRNEWTQAKEALAAEETRGRMMAERLQRIEAFESTSARCHRTGQQNCDFCEDMDCGDNTSAGAQKIRMLEAEQETHDRPSGLVHRAMFDQARAERDEARAELKKRIETSCWTTLVELRDKINELIEVMGNAGVWLQPAYFGGRALNARDDDERWLATLKGAGL